MADLVTLTEANDALPDLVGNAALPLLITAASDAVRTYLRGREVDRAERTEVFDGKGRTYVTLTHIPIVEVASVSLGGVDQVVAAVNKKTGRLTIEAGAYTAGVANVEVTYTGGYDPVPGDVKLAVLLTIRGATRTASTTAGAYVTMEQVLTTGYMVQYAAPTSASATAILALPDSAKDLLKNYRNRRV